MSLRLYPEENLSSIIKSSSRNLVSQSIGNGEYQWLTAIEKDAGNEGARGVVLFVAQRRLRFLAGRVGTGVLPVQACFGV
ncbi:uncharacterized protein DS421_5g160110 [Arachis hypogaea]|nr:uncharacterized protein DS421_5g160110 [Arachis hypogaea]